MTLPAAVEEWLDTELVPPGARHLVTTLFGRIVADDSTFLEAEDVEALEELDQVFGCEVERTIDDARDLLHVQNAELDRYLSVDLLAQHYWVGAASKFSTDRKQGQKMRRRAKNKASHNLASRSSSSTNASVAPEHGSVERYFSMRCRCPECRRAYRTHEQEQKR